MKGWTRSFLFLLLIAAAISGCKSKKASLGEFKVRNAKQLAKELALAQSEFVWYATKARMKFKGERSFSGTATIKMKRDSIVWSSVSPGFGIEAARAQLLQDSAMYLNRLEKTYAIYPNSDLRKLLGMDNLGLSQLQSIFAGDPPFSIGEKPELKVAGKELALVSTVEGVAYEAWLRPDNYKLHKLSLMHQASGQAAEINFSNYLKTAQGFLPGLISIEVKGESPISVQFSTNRIEVGAKQRMSFSVPSSYGRQK